MKQQSDVSAPRDLFTVEQLAERRPAWTQQALRALILNAADRLNSKGEVIHGNGLAEAGAIVRIGRRVLISEDHFFMWVASQQKLAVAQTRQRARANAPSEQRPSEPRVAA